MKSSLKDYGLVVLAFAILFSGIFFLFNQQKTNASVTIGNEYQSVLVDSTYASSSAKTVIRTGSGSLGSVIIASSSAVTAYPSITLYDATSTMATSSARKIAVFGGNNSQHGTYTFDTVYNYGLSVEVPVGFNGKYTVTYH